MKRISEKKLEAFTVGAMGKCPPSRKELEVLKKKEEEEAAAHVFKEFVETFQETPSPYSKVWVKAGTYDAGSRREDSREKGKLYKPTSKVEEKGSTEKAQDYAKLFASESKKDSLAKKKSQEKKKSNLELFKEELRQIQEEREERHKYKHMASQSVKQDQPIPEPDMCEKGSFDTGDPCTTNLYLGNLNPKITEQQLVEVFGRYGPLASIKIMWPRSEEEKQRNRNCGFVAYMSRKDAERALRMLNGRYIMGREMRMGWSKAVPIMTQPIFIPLSLLELTMPPPPSGLPFNAQPPQSEAPNVPKKNYKEYTEEEKEDMKRILEKSVVKVCIPTDKAVLNTIHRMIEFVIREGPMFEALIMNREMYNPQFSFLFDNESPAHIYYRWKLFSLLQGDSVTEWSEKPFRMFKDGPVWKPPIANFYTQGMPDELVVDPNGPEINKGALSTAQRDRLEDLIRHLTPERSRIGDAMIFCIEHAEAADEICDCIAESLANPGTLPSKKIARLYLLSDILHNCTVKVSNASFFRKAIEKQLQEIFENLRLFFMAIESRLKAEGFKSRVLKVLAAWEEWAVYPKDFLANLKNIFLGKPLNTAEEIKEEIAADEDIDGAPLAEDNDDEEDLDGVPLDGAALLKSALLRLPESMPLRKDTPTHRLVNSGGGDAESDEYNDDIDGVPLDEDIDGIPLEKPANTIKSEASLGTKTKPAGFIPSKWETVDPEQVEAQAVTSSKWDTLDPPDPPKFYDSSDEESRPRNSNEDKVYRKNKDDAINDRSYHGSSSRHRMSNVDSSDDGNSDVDEQPIGDDIRSKLREIEMKTMQYQDELESGQRDLRDGWSIPEQVEHYRRKLFKREAATRRSQSPEEYERKHSNYRSRRSPSPASSSRSGGGSYSGGVASRPAVSKRHRSPSSSNSPPLRRRERRNSGERNNNSNSSHGTKASRYGGASPSMSSTSFSNTLRSPSPVSYSGGLRSSKRVDERDIHGPSANSRSDRHKHRHKY